MIQPRNNLVGIRVRKTTDKVVGKVIVPANGDAFREAYIEAIGPGNVLMGGSRPDTFDLQIGQCVLVKLFQKTPTGLNMPCGIELVDECGQYYLVAESSIVGIIPPTTEILN